MNLHRVLPCALLVLCATWVQSSSAQSEPCAVAIRSSPAQLRHEIAVLLQRETEALDEYQHQLAPAVSCEYADNVIRQGCQDMLTKLKDEVKQSKRDIGRYRSSGDRQPADLFDIYVGLQSLLKDIETLQNQDYFNGRRNQRVLANAYNSFIKLTDVWFTGEIRETMKNLAH